MDNTSRVAQWRQRMRDEGKEAVTVWLRHDTKLRLEDLASVCLSLRITHTYKFDF